MKPLEIGPASKEADIADVRKLFEEYAAWIAVDLSFQNFAEELKRLPGDYAPPAGALFIARSEASPVGCIAVRRIDERDCEMKRLFVRDGFRGLGAGERLATHAVEWARARGYHRMLLDTLPSMGAAHQLYARLGFTDVPPYRFNPIPGSRFMAKSLIET